MASEKLKLNPLVLLKDIVPYVESRYRTLKGAENRAIQHRLFFGYDNERLIRATRVPVLVVVPHLGNLARDV